MQSNYCIIESFNHSFLKNNIETKGGCRFDKVIREICEKSCKYVHQILIIVNKDNTVNQRRFSMVWKGYVGKLFDSVVSNIF